MTTRKRRAVITEETTVTRRQIALTDTETDTIIPGTQPVRYAPGWHAVPRLAGPGLREQRHRQVMQAARLVVAAAMSGDSTDDRYVVTTAACILRAGPGASPLELLYGRVL